MPLARRWLALALLLLLGVQSLGSRALLVCLCEPAPLVATAAVDCCPHDPETEEGEDLGEATSDPSGDGCRDCVVIALGLDDALIQAAPVFAFAPVVPRWSELLVPAVHPTSTRLALLARPPPRPDPGLRHLATVRLTI